MPRLATHFFFQFTTEGNVEKENRKKHGKKITAKKQLFERHPAAQATSGIGGTALKSKGSAGIATLGQHLLSEKTEEEEKKRGEG